jgi:DNA-binding NarL/FixJ family response regulator
MRFEELGDAENGSRDPKPVRAARLLIADDHALVREGLRTMLSGEYGIEVVAEAHNGEQALSLCRELEPDLVLMDVRMPVMDGLEATKRIKAEMPQTSVMMVTMHENPDYLFEAVKAGAAGYVLKDASGERLLGAVRRTLDGESPLNQELAMRLLVRLSRESDRGSAEREERESGDASIETPGERPDAGRPPEFQSQEIGSEAGTEANGSGRSGAAAEEMESLTPREIEVLRLLSQGQTNPQIAQNLEVSRGTVKIHVQHIISKLGVSDRTQAAVRAIEAGILS